MVTLWIDPASSTFAAPSEPTTGLLTANTGTDGFTIDRFNMRQNTAASVPAAMQWDELRIGRSWADVTPPASSATILQDPIKLTTGAFQFGFTNNTGLNSSVYASTNLVDWQSIGTGTQLSAGFYRYTDQTATNYPRRFYKLR